MSTSKLFLTLIGFTVLMTKYVYAHCDETPCIKAFSNLEDLCYTYTASCGDYFSIPDVHQRDGWFAVREASLYISYDACNEITSIMNYYRSGVNLQENQGSGSGQSPSGSPSSSSPGTNGSPSTPTTSPSSNPSTGSSPSSPVSNPSSSPSSSPTSNPNSSPLTSPTSNPNSSPSFSPTSNPSSSPTSGQP